MKVRFKKPPVSELIIGVFFDAPLPAFRSQHIGLLWSRLRKDFPTAEQQPPLFGRTDSDQELALSTGDEFLIMPRYWFVSEKEGNLIQVQKNAFLLNWRKRNTDLDYPHFDEHLKPSFDRYFKVFKKFLREDVDVPSPKIGRCELTYIDVIDSCKYWRGPQDTPKLIPSFAFLNSGLTSNAASAFNCMYSHDIGSHLQLHVTIRTAEEASGASDSVRLILEFKAFGRPVGTAKSDIDAWYDEAHDVIIERFLKMTDENVRKTHWGQEEIE